MWGGCGVQDKSSEHIRAEPWERCKDKKWRSFIPGDWYADWLSLWGVSSALRESYGCIYYVVSVRPVLGYTQALTQSGFSNQQPAASGPIFAGISENLGLDFEFIECLTFLSHSFLFVLPVDGLILHSSSSFIKKTSILIMLVMLPPPWLIS